MIHRPLSIITMLAVFTVLVGLPGCRAAGPEGTYVLDKVAMKAAMDEIQADPEDPGAAMGAAMMAGMLDSVSMSITLNADGTASATMSDMGDSETGTGTWTMSGNAITLTWAEKGGTEQSMSGTVEGNTLTLNPGKDNAMQISLIFNKQPS